MKKHITLVTLSAIIITLFSTILLAKNFNFDANIKILEALDVVETKRMDFGIIEIPNEDVMVDITPNGNIGQENSAIYVNDSSISAGKYKIFGSQNSSISLTAKNGGNVANMSFKKLPAIYGQRKADLLKEGLNALDAPTSEGTELILGGVLEVKSSIKEGSYAPDFILIVNYE